MAIENQQYQKIVININAVELQQTINMTNIKIWQRTKYYLKNDLRSKD